MNSRSWRLLFTLFSSISMLFCTSYSEKAPNYSFMRPAAFAPPVSYFDYIVIGGGPAGCALAATLSRGAHVLLLERGGAPYGNENVEYIQGFAVNLEGNSSPSNAAQTFMSEDGVINARAQVLGGGSAINAGFYTRADGGFLNKVGLDGSLVNESYAWVERKVAFKPPMLEFQSAFRDGLMEVGVTPYNGFTYDHINGTKIGGTIFDANGKRHTAADLLEYAIPNRTAVYLFATVHKILFTTKGQHSQKPRAHGVIFRDTKGMKHKAYLKPGPGPMNEIIISAGAIGSPQLLMLSGIGPASHLKQLGINVVVDQPMVGQGMSDNPMNAVMVLSPNPVELSLIQAVGITEFGTYIEAASGLSLASGIIHSFPGSAASNQASQPSSIPNNDQSAKYSQKAYELMSSLQSETMYAGLILEKAIGPLSKGHLYLKTKNPNDNPLVTFNYFKEEEDLARCVKGMEIIIKVMESKSFAKFRYPGLSVQDLLTTMLSLPLNQRPRQSNGTEFSDLRQYCKDTVMTIWHYHGGCLVGRVVDKDYKVFNVSGLRVIDGSTFYDSPGTNPQATVMMLGRYMGQRITKERFAAS